MPKTGFSEALDELLEQDTRYDREGYLFLRDSLEFTLKQKRKGRSGEIRHVTAAELMDGVRVFALREFGPMVPTVFNYWGVHSCEDLGVMVFNLINAGIFGKNDNDAIDDFKTGFDFHTAFVAPYLPENSPRPIDHGRSAEPVAEVDPERRLP
ncbi:MAG TPA: Minf_1886 family protein [Chthoniobacterales bacterium]